MKRWLLFASTAVVIAPVASLAQQAPVAAAPQNPFQITPEEQAFLDQVLAKWEAESAKVQTFSCPFTRYVYNQFAPASNVAFQVQQGKVSYQKPDKGSFKVDQIEQWKAQPVTPGQPAGPAKGDHVVVFPDPNGGNNGIVGDHWVSDGKNIFEYRQHVKELAVTPIPPELQGEQIVNGPFPFLFGAKADDLKRRYWMAVKRDNPDPNVIHLVAQPKTRAGAAEYRYVELMLDRRTLLPSAMQLHLLDNSREVFDFKLAEVSVNGRIDRLWGALFSSPRTPWGWKRVVSPQPDQQQPPAQQAAGPGNARR